MKYPILLQFKNTTAAAKNTIVLFNTEQTCRIISTTKSALNFDPKRYKVGNIIQSKILITSRVWAPVYGVTII